MHRLKIRAKNTHLGHLIELGQCDPRGQPKPMTKWVKDDPWTTQTSPNPRTHQPTHLRPSSTLKKQKKPREGKKKKGKFVGLQRGRKKGVQTSRIQGVNQSKLIPNQVPTTKR